MKLSVRLDHEAAECIARWHWKYHHTGIPTTAIMPGEIHIPHLGMYVSGFSTSPFGIEWMRFEQGSPVHPLVQRVPHVAFEVYHLERELSLHDFVILTPPTQPSEGVRVAMIEHNGAPVELIEFSRQSPPQQDDDNE
ncbi:hypothetical protein [uncultured Desulfovibrio sp.]|uniref:hypothetical protein n=1 Tax=uncultured Desulfovibrio sp. TaxID=167968 RepID=UPI002615377A|nr:hypothetical protein [uncultured Desulfovibrio sp.]